LCRRVPSEPDEKSEKATLSEMPGQKERALTLLPAPGSMLKDRLRYNPTQRPYNDGRKVHSVSQNSQSTPKHQLIQSISGISERQST